MGKRASKVEWVDEQRPLRDSIKAARKLFGLTLLDLAKICGYSTHGSTIQRLNGLMAFDDVHVNRIIEVCKGKLGETQLEIMMLQKQELAMKSSIEMMERFR